MRVRNTRDNREKDRIPHKAIIRFCAGEQDECRTARMINYSSTGMYLELNYPPPKLGANLLIEILENEELQNPMEEYRNPKTCYYAKVIWKKNLPDSNSEYGVGLRYLSSVPPES